MKLVKKLTVKTVLERKPNAALLGDKDSFDIMTVYGTAEKAEPGTHDFGDGNVSHFVKFRGNFAAVRVSDGEEFRSGVLILPDVAGDVLAGVVSEDGGDAVGFAFLIQIKKADTTVGYEYGASPLTEPEEHDPLNAMRAKLAGAPGIPQLEAPETADKAPSKKQARKTG